MGGGHLARYYQSSEVQCPFYLMEESYRIHCEGLDKDATMIQEFNEASRASGYKQRYCHAEWTRCRIARMLWKQYDDIGNLRLMGKVSPFLVRGEKP